MSIKKNMEKKIKDCPRCWVPMRKERVRVFGPYFEVDRCPKCKGVWFDPGELDRIVGKGIGGHLTRHIGTQSKSELVCPRCGGVMDLEYAEDVEVDACLTCGGAWLDEGELEALWVKRAEGYTGDPSQKVVELEEEIEASERRKKRR